MSQKPAIICVDDERVVLVGIRSQLRNKLQEDYEILTAESAEEALELMEEMAEEGVDVPLVISDQIMPGMKGDQFLISVHKQWPNTRTILLTGQADANAVGNALNHAKLYRYLSKPWEDTDLLMTVQQAANSYYKDVQLEVQNRQLRDLNENLEQKVAQRTEELQRKNQDIMDSINYGSRIQRALLPTEAEIRTAFPNSFLFFRPKDVVSGDFYWMAQRDGKTIIAAADCTGHGVPGAFMSVLGRSALYEIVEQRGITDPALILSAMHARVTESLTVGGETLNDGMDIIICAFDAAGQSVQFAGANRPLFIWQDGQIETLQPDKRPVGHADLDDTHRGREYARHDVALRPGMFLYLTTDGYFDQFGGPQGRKFGRSRFLEMLQSIGSHPANAQCAHLTTALDEWQSIDSKAQTDDMLLIGIGVL